MTDRELEQTLAAVGLRLAYPASARVAPVVRERIARRAAPRPAWAQLLAPAVITLLVLAAGVAATELIRLNGIEILRAPSLPSPQAPPSGTPRVPGAGRVGSVDEAARQLGFQPLAPAELGAPDDVLIAVPRPGVAQVTLVYDRVPGIPRSEQAGASVLLTEVRGGTIEVPILGKVAGPGTLIEELLVNGGRGVWLEGAPHQVFYREAGGEVVQDTLRLARNTLLWEQAGLLLRLEAQVPRERALAIAASVR